MRLNHIQFLVLDQNSVIHNDRMLFSGCNSTSTFFGKGKGTVFKWLMKNKKFQDMPSRFQNENLAKEEVIQIGCSLVCGLYENDCADDKMCLNDYWYSILTIFIMIIIIIVHD